MLIDGRTLDGSSEISCDILIVGAGPAGLALAMDLDPSLDVVILERGGETATGFLNTGKVPAHDGYSYDLEKSRGIGFGGASGLWNFNPGWQVRPLDTMDFEKRDWVPESGWPITREQMEPYYRKAHALLEMENTSYDPVDWVEDSEVLDDLTEEEWSLGLSVMRYAELDAFTTKKALFEKDPKRRVILHSAVADFVSNDQGNRIVTAVARTSAGGSFSIRADQFVLAAGGIENVGILLNTDLAKGNDHVGRYFMEHPHLSPGEVVFEKGFQTDKLKAFVASAYKGFQGERPAAATEQGRLVFRTSREFCEKHKIGNCLLWGNLTTAGVATGGVRSLHELQRLKDLEIEPPEGVRQKHLSNILSSPGSIAGSTVKKQLARLRRKLGQPQDENAFFLHMETEQVPNPDSRVVLTNELDEFGLPRTTLDWKLSDFDHASIATTLREFGNTLKANGIGRLRNSLSENDPVPQIGGGCHHMGGTRMSADAKSGVVDANLRLHGTENFYIAGSSCFPTSGASNPTLTLIALSVRLAEELNAKATKEHQPNTVRASESA